LAGKGEKRPTGGELRRWGYVKPENVRTKKGVPRKNIVGWGKGARGG